MNKKPHIIIFNPDEMRADTMSHMGNPAAVTPNIDAFVRDDAVSFSRAYCQNPVCVPSRCSFFTGLYPHVRGHRTMEHLLRPGEETLFSELRRNGYYVWMNTRNDLLAGQIDGWANSHADEIYYGGEHPAAPGPLNPDIRGELGSKYYYSHFAGQLGLDENGRNYNGDDDAVDAAIKRLLDPPDDRPMCLFLGMQYPHCPYQVEEPYFSAIDRSKLPARIKPEDCSGKAKILDLIREYAALDQFNESDWDELRAVYLGMCMKVDDQFGRMINALKDAGIYDDCAIFFLSDHGDFAGDYGLPEKAQNSFEDCLTRVPLLIKPPKGVDIVPGVSDALCELIDFYATALDFAGARSPHVQFGRSLRENLADRSAAVRKYAYCEGGRIPDEKHADEYSTYAGGAPTSTEYWPKMMAQHDDEAHSKGIMMRGERYKYISRVSNNDELYDMESDPNETTNLFYDPARAGIIAEMKFDMLKWLQTTSDIVPYDLDARWTPDMMLNRMKRTLSPDKLEIAKAMMAEGKNAVEIATILRGK